MKVGSATVETPHAVRACLGFVQALSIGDLDTATACFARDGCLITADATAVHGRDRIRPLIAQLVARRTEIKVEFSHVVRAGDVVIANECWKVRSGGGEAPQVEQVLNPMLVLRRIEAQWKLAIAAPWGWGRPYP
jgi:ketosteroid isomerase-like protein